MKELYIEGVATHDDPESCVGICKGVGEALTGARAGGATEPRNTYLGCRRCSHKRKATSLSAITRVDDGLCVVGELMHARNLYAREPGDPVFTQPVDHQSGRFGKAKAPSRR